MFIMPGLVFSGMRVNAALLAFLLCLLAVIPVVGVRYTGVIDYPPLSYPPSDMVVDDAGRIWFALPLGRSVALYVPDVGLNNIELGFSVSDLVYGYGVVVAYEAGSSELVFIDSSTGKVLWKSVEAGLIDAVVTVDGGFVLVKNFPTMTVLTHLSPEGNVLWEGRITDRQLERFRPAAASGRYVWLKTVDGNLLMVELGREGYREFKLDKKPVVLASRDGKVWAVDSDGGVARLSIRGVELRLNTEFRARVGDIGFALPGDRLVILSRLEGFIRDISGGQVSSEQLQASFTLAALKGPTLIYLLDSSEKRIVIASVSRPPAISDTSATPVENGVRVKVVARVTDPDGDLAEGYPRVVGVLGSEVATQQMSLSGGVYSAELVVPEGDGVLRVYVQALDVGGNEARLEVANYQVEGGRISGSGPTPTVTTTPTATTPTDLSSLFPIAVEMAFFLVLVTALVVILLGRPRRARRRRR